MINLEVLRFDSNPGLLTGGRVARRLPWFQERRRIIATSHDLGPQKVAVWKGTVQVGEIL